MNDGIRTTALVNKLLEAMNHSGLMLMISIGHRTGLFDVMAACALRDAAKLSPGPAGLNERYVREWLGAMVTGRSRWSTTRRTRRTACRRSTRRS